MIPTTSVGWSDWPLSNDHLDRSIKKRDSGRQEGAAAEKAVPFSAPLFDAAPSFASTPLDWLESAKEKVQGHSTAQAEEESSISKGGSK